MEVTIKINVREAKTADEAIKIFVRHASHTQLLGESVKDTNFFSDGRYVRLSVKESP